MSFFALKIVALLSMLWDHVTYVRPLSMTLEALFFPDAAETVPALLVLQRATDYIGRIAAPIFLFSIANGYRNTRSFNRYALRLLLFACLAEYPYYLLFGFHGNIMFTLLLGLLTLRLMDWSNEKRAGLGYALAAVAVIAAEYFGLTEGGGRYVLFILVFYLTEHWTVRKKAPPSGGINCLLPRSPAVAGANQRRISIVRLFCFGLYHCQPKTSTYGKFTAAVSSDELSALQNFLWI